MLSYQDVYTAARDLDTKRIPETKWVDYLKDCWTPAGRLAYENNSDAVAFLLSRGADPKAIAEGYAMVGEHTNVETYRLTHGANIDVIAKAYAQVNNLEKVEIYEQLGANIDEVAAGYGLAGNDSP